MLCYRCGRNLMNRMSPLNAGLIIMCLTALTKSAIPVSYRGSGAGSQSEDISLGNILDPVEHGIGTFNVNARPKLEVSSNDASLQDQVKNEEPLISLTSDHEGLSKKEMPGQGNEHLKRLLISVQNLRNRASKDRYTEITTQYGNSANKTTIQERRDRKLGSLNITNSFHQRTFHPIKNEYHVPKSSTHAPSLSTNKKENNEKDNIVSQPESTGNVSHIVEASAGLHSGDSMVTIQSDHDTQSKISSVSNITLSIAETNRPDITGYSEGYSSTSRTTPYIQSVSDDRLPVTVYSKPCVNCSDDYGERFKEIERPIEDDLSLKPEVVLDDRTAQVPFQLAPTTLDPPVSSDVSTTFSPDSNHTVNDSSSLSTDEHRAISEHLTEQTRSSTDLPFELIPQTTGVFQSLAGTETQNLTLSLDKKQSILETFYPTLFENSVRTEISTETIPRRGKMSHSVSLSNQSKKSKAHSKDYFDPDYDQTLGRHINHGYSIPEFQPGAILHYLEPFRRRPVMEEKTQQPTPLTNERIYMNFPRNSGFGVRTKHVTTDVPTIGSTFYPFRVEDISVKIPRRHSKVTTMPTTTLSTNTRFDSHNNKDENTEKRRDEEEEEEDDDDEDYIDIHESSLTMETLAYFLIGTCCGLSILCLCIVVFALRCRRTLVHRRIRKQFRGKLCYANNGNKILSSVWQQQFLNHVMQQQDNKRNNSSFSSSNTCNCRCVTWSLGARNLDTQPICPSRSSVYLCGRKKLPFGAASTLQYESMLGRRRQTSPPLNRDPPPKPESSNENDSLDGDSGTEPTTSMCPKQCTCIRPPWMVHRTQSSYSACSIERTPSVRNCIRGTSEIGIELRRFNRDCPPPVSGMNYLDRADGVVYWSSNDERLI